MRSVSRHDQRRNVATVSKAESSRNTQMSAPKAEASNTCETSSNWPKTLTMVDLLLLRNKGSAHVTKCNSTLTSLLLTFFFLFLFFFCNISSKVQLNGISSVPSNRNNLSVTPASTSFTQNRNLNFHLMWKPAVWKDSTKWRNTFFSNIQMNWPSSWKTSSCVLQDS